MLSSKGELGFQKGCGLVSEKVLVLSRHFSRRSRGIFLEGPAGAERTRVSSGSATSFVKKRLLIE